MQKKIIAVAVAGLSTAAFAQTNVTIYGVADVSAQGYTMSAGKALPYAASNTAGKTAAGSVFSLQSNSSLIGFKGTEDLGNGLKALFQAESGVNLTGGSAVQVQGGSMFGGLRDSYVGLNSKYGTALAGFLSTPYRSALTSFDVLPGATGNGQIEKMMGGMRIGAAAAGAPGTQYLALDSSVRATAIAYAMPTLYGFDGSIAYTGSANNGQNNNTTIESNPSASASSAPVQSALSMNLGWTGYGVNIKGAFQQANTNYPNSTATVTNDFGSYTSYLIGAMYTGLPGLKTSVVYGRNTLGINATDGGANKLSNNQLYAGASYRMGNWEPRISATWSSDINGSDVQQLGARQWVLNTGYYLSKRTQVYGLISNLNNSANQNYFAGLQTSNLKPTGGQNLFSYGLGMRTTF